MNCTQLRKLFENCEKQFLNNPSNNHYNDITKINDVTKNYNNDFVKQATLFNCILLSNEINTQCEIKNIK